MDIAINGALYPRVKSYLSALPQGAESYPDHKTTTDFSLLVWPKVAELIAEPTFPQPLRAWLDQPMKAGAWMPVTVVVTYCMLLRDRAFPSDEAYTVYLNACLHDLFRKPLYRAMMLVLSPNLLVIGAAKRWGSFYRGTELQTVKMDKHQVTLRLQFPIHLFPREYLESLGVTFCAAIACAKATAPRYKLTEISTTSATYEVSWT